jgi:cytoskeleton protein RodZ
MSDTEQGRLLLPGQRLRSGREALGLSQADIAARMHLSVSYIRALEADDYARLPQAAFVRGYIKNYARLVNLPGDELANLFQQMLDESRPASPAPAPAADTDRRLWWIGGAAGFVLIIWLLWPTSVAQRERAVEPAPMAETDMSLINADEDFAEEFPEEAGPLEVPSADSAAPVMPTAPAVDRLTIRFSEACWLRVRDVDGNEIYVGERRADQPLQLEGRGPFRITLGNAAAVSAISVNDASVRIPAVAAGQVITVRAP